MPQLAKLSSKGQITIPIEVRKSLHLTAGDTLLWDIQRDGQLVVRKVEPIDVAYLSALNGTLSEWDSPEDDEAFNGL